MWVVGNKPKNPHAKAACGAPGAGTEEGFLVSLEMAESVAADKVSWKVRLRGLELEMAVSCRRALGRAAAQRIWSRASRVRLPTNCAEPSTIICGV